MGVVWEPDPQNVYLTSGSDNLALHELPRESDPGSVSQQLDHLGFVVETIERVKELEKEFQAKDVPIVVLTGTEDETLGVQLIQAGAQDYLVKAQETGSLTR